MRFTGAIACFIVAIDCAQNATGSDHVLFQAGSLWMWWFFCAAWAINGIAFLWRA